MINNLSLYRRKAKLTQEQFAAQLGVATGTLSKWEDPEFDLRKLNILSINKICEILNISIYDLVEIEKGEN